MADGSAELRFDENDVAYQEPEQAPTDRRIDPTELVAGLTPPQLSSVVPPGGPLLIVAGAGSGKTRVLTRRIAHLIATRAAAPWQILAITFTNKAADEMRRRVVELVGTAATGCGCPPSTPPASASSGPTAIGWGTRARSPSTTTPTPDAWWRSSAANSTSTPRSSPPARSSARSARPSRGKWARASTAGRRPPSSTGASPKSSTCTSNGWWRPTPWTSTTSCSTPFSCSVSTPTSS